MAILGIPTSRKDLGNAGWIKGAATTGARGLANVASVLPGSDPGGVQKARNFADAIDDPNMGYSGSLNPYSILNQVDNSGSAFTRTSPGGGGAPAASGGQQLDANGQPVGASQGLYAGDVKPYDPNVDPARIAAQRNEITGLMQAFDVAFRDVFGQVDNLASEKKAEFIKNYERQKEGLRTNLTNTAGQIDNQMSARNAFNSSYRAREQGVAQDAFNTAFTGLEEAEQGDLASVGRFADEQKASLNAARPNYNLNDYQEVDDLLQVKQDVDKAVRELTKTQAGLRTNSQYRQNLDKIAPKQEQGSAQLKAQLDRLAGTGANPETKRFIAKSMIDDAGEDETQYLDYFERVLGQTGSQASGNIVG